MSDASYSGPKHPAADCEGCTLYKEKYVPNKLPHDATVAFIAEAPGQQEVRGGAPFLGASGKLLHRAAADAGIERSTVAEMNVVGCRPPGNRTPTSTEVVHCRGRMYADLEAIPTIETVVTLGATATREITGDKTIATARVGPPRAVDIKGKEYKVVSTYHPAACLRTGDWYPFMANDLRKVHQEASTWQPPEWRLIDNAVEAVAWLDARLLVASYPWVVDIEVGIEKDSDFAHPERYQFLCIGFASEREVVVIGEEALKFPQTLQWIKKFVRHHKMICHNGKFDMAGLGEENLWFDTMLASYILDERAGTNSLEYNSVEILGSPEWKSELDQYLGENKNYADIPRDILYRYNAWDDWNTWLLFKYFEAQLTPKQRWLHDMLCRVSIMFAHCEMKGMNLDFEYLRKMDVEMQDELWELEKVCQEWVANPRSPQQVKKAFYELGWNVPSTKEIVLTDLARRANEEVCRFIDALLKYRKRQKIHSTYVKGLLSREHEGRIHTSILVHGTVMGRASSRNPNIHNQPRGPLIRSAFLPDPGFVLVQGDYKTAELRVCGIEANDQYLINVLSDPSRDIHGEVADQRYGVGQWTADQRVRAKAVVFGVSYGREAGSIALEFGIPQKEAESVRNAFLALIPDVVAWQNDLWRRITEEGWDIENHFGRKRRFHLITRDNIVDVQNEAKAFIPQSTANDITFMAAERLYSRDRMDIRILVHDSILAQCRPDEASDVGNRMAEVMMQTARDEYSDLIPFFVDVKAGNNWGELV